MVKIGARFKLREPLPASLLAGSSAPGACPSCKELTLRGFGVQSEIEARTHELSTTEPPTDDGLRSRGLAFARRVVRLAPGIPLEQQIVLPNSGDTVGISWRLLGNEIMPVRLIATPIFSALSQSRARSSSLTLITMAVASRGCRFVVSAGSLQIPMDIAQNHP
jgi:hypothetical protein